jgi:uncharacterized protein (DUF1499 family)
MRWLAWLFWIVVGLVILVFLAGQLGLLKGRAPNDLGVREGKLKPPSRTPNSVSSQAHLYQGEGAEYARIEPFTVSGDEAQALARVKSIVEKMPGAQIVEAKPDYLYAQFTTQWLKFVDDVEFWVAPKNEAGEVVMHVRSASRIGRKDFGVNRARIESIRAMYAAGS